MRIIALAFVCMVLAACSQEKPSPALYPGPWKDDANFALVKTLVANKVGGCREIWYRTRSGDDDGQPEYLVYCTSDGRTWVAWLAWPSRNKITGPNPTYPDIAPPR
jgi:hypothetical protein